MQTNLALDVFFQETGVWEEPDEFERQWQIPREKLLPEVGLFWGRLLSKRNLCRNPCFGKVGNVAQELHKVTSG